jgi:hypothetical protein
MGLKRLAGSRGTHGTAQRAVGSCIAVFRSAGVESFWIVLWLLGVFAAGICSPTKSYAAEAVTLRVVPKLCVKPVGNELCAMQISATWTASTAMDVCLRFGEETEPLQCWQSQRQGELSVATEREGNTAVQLLDAHTLAVLSAVEISVIERDVRDTRRRRRHAWSIL